MPDITVAIPTLHRPDLIPEAIRSVLAQTFRDFELLVVDNSEDNQTKQIVETFADARIRYMRTGRPLTVIDCWNECINLCNTEYLHIFADDDRLHPRFLERSVGAHRQQPLGFTFTHATKVDDLWNRIRLWGYEFPPAGRISGSDYLSLTLTHECCLTLAPTVVVPRAVYDAIGGYRNGLAQNTFDFNFYLRVARHYDVFFIDESLVDYRLHSRQLTEAHWRTGGQPTGKIGTYLELIATVSSLIGADHRPALDQSLLGARLLSLDTSLAMLLKSAFPAL